MNTPREVIYRAISTFTLSDLLFEVTVMSGEDWKFVGVKPNGNVFKRGPVTITLSNEVVSHFFLRIL